MITQFANVSPRQFEMSFKWNNATTCIGSNALTTIAQAVTHLLEQEEGCYCISQPPPTVRDLKQLRTHPEYTASDLWMVGLFPRDDWTIVKTWPHGLFCQRAAGANRPRLSALAMQLGCDAFHFWVGLSFNSILLEADAIGRTFTSGYPGIEYDDKEWFYQERIDVLGMRPQFSLLKVSEALQAAMRVNEYPEIELERKQAEWEQLIESEDLDPDLLLELDIELTPGVAERVDHGLAKVIDSSKFRAKSCWYLLDLVYDAYAETERLEAFRAQLLYFQPPMTYKPPRYYVRHEPPSEDEGDEF